MSIDSAPLQGDIVPMSTGITSMSVDIDPLPVDRGRPSGGIGPFPADSETMSVDIAPLQPDWNRCPLASIHRKAPPATASRLRSDAAGAGPWPAGIATFEI